MGLFEPMHLGGWAGAAAALHANPLCRVDLAKTDAGRSNL
jgi:hypothetical protein